LKALSSGRPEGLRKPNAETENFPRGRSLLFRETAALVPDAGGIHVDCIDRKSLAAAAIPNQLRAVTASAVTAKTLQQTMRMSCIPETFGVA
jgi:hypothetical protein